MYQPTHISNMQGCTTICVNVCVLRRVRHRGRKEQHLKDFMFLVKYVYCHSALGGWVSFQGFLYQKEDVFICLHTHADIRVGSRCWEYFVSVKVVQPHIGEEINHSPLDSSEDTFRGVRKPTAFILFPYGNIHRCCLEWHSYAESSRAGVVVRRDDYFQCNPSNFIFCSWGDEMEMLHHIKDKMLRLFLKVMALSDKCFVTKTKVDGQKYIPL